MLVITKNAEDYETGILELIDIAQPTVTTSPIETELAHGCTLHVNKSWSARESLFFCATSRWFYTAQRTTYGTIILHPLVLLWNRSSLEMTTGGIGLGVAHKRHAWQHKFTQFALYRNDNCQGDHPILLAIDGQIRSRIDLIDGRIVAIQQGFA